MTILSKILTPLAATCAVCAAAYPSHAEAASVLVTNCSDAGPGSLRAVVANAHSGDLIDMRALSCTRIVLTSGAIPVTQASLTLLGAGESNTVVDGNNANRVFLHAPAANTSWSSPDSATLRLLHMSAVHGLDEKTQGAEGGCIFSLGNVRLEYAQVHHCVARSTTPTLPFAHGGAIFAAGDVVMFHAAVFSSMAESDIDAIGGGVYAGDLLHVDRSSIHDNSSSGYAGGAYGSRVFATYSTIRDNDAYVFGGGLWSNGATVFNKSTLSGNQCRYGSGGGTFMGAIGDVVISDSTISGNISVHAPAGIELDGSSRRVSVVNTTIAFNAAVEGAGDGGGGITQSGTVRYNSSIIARNTIGGRPDDIFGRPYGAGARMTGANNLIETAKLVVPNDTIRTDPLLAPLANNGGGTLTHALRDGSPAIDHGNNVAGFFYDERGVGYPRVVGSRADIGAFESQAP